MLALFRLPQRFSPWPGTGRSHGRELRGGTGSSTGQLFTIAGNAKAEQEEHEQPAVDSDGGVR